ncbi:hypothetical protein [Lysinibacillus piscis]|uniref:DUF4306 domain-containing protein n=1 Tax=Lysinibacillus piscis TaxID=2518931 RepID=A0ABQ5NI97_9BACI|nr:hypothetical protein [Lysinibacillus sp. KH24]GLC88037.1 hypothetical protein LYSBPC_11640 [Lysinibacillus sp. KH24]
MKNKSKKGLLWGSIVITILSIFLVSYESNNFGAPFQFVRYIGDKELQTGFSLFSQKNFTQIHFNILYFFIDVAIFYFILLYGNKKITLLKSNKKDQNGN